MKGQKCTYILLEKQQQTYNKNISSNIKKGQTDYMERFNISGLLHKWLPQLDFVYFCFRFLF